MAVTHEALLETRHAFDTVARTYDQSNAQNPLLREIRHRTLAAVTAHVPVGSRLLDLGCGPGSDAEFLARHGYRVMAIDWSPEMAREAHARISLSRLDAGVQVRRLGIHELDRLPAQSFDAAYSDLGPLNCVPDLRDAARLTAERRRTGGMLIASVIGRVCPWEVALYASRGDWMRARVRFSRLFVPVPLNGRTVWTRYYAPGEFEATFAAAGFERVSLRAMGLLVPPPYMQAFAERHPHLISWLQALEDRVAGRPGFRAWGDHFLIVMRKQEHG